MDECDSYYQNQYTNNYPKFEMYLYNQTNLHCKAEEMLSSKNRSLYIKEFLQNNYPIYFKNNIDKKPKKLIPPVPKFDNEDEVELKKKIKTNPTQQIEVNIYKQEEKKIIQVKGDKIFTPNKEQDFLTNGDENQQKQRNFQSKELESREYNLLNQSNQDNSINKIHESSSSPELSPSNRTSECNSDEMIAKKCSITNLAENNAKLDKKDVKKLEKFIELLHDFMNKLQLKDSCIEAKYIEFVTIIIPSLNTHFKSKPFEAIAGAILLYTCREIQHPITIKQITSVSNTKDKLVNKCIFTLKDLLPKSNEIKQFSSHEFIEIINQKISLADNIRLVAIDINQNINKLGLLKSIHASTLAACCIKYASALSDNEKTFDEIAQAANISKMTLRNMYRELFPYRFYFIKGDCKLPKGPIDLKNI